MERVGHGHQQTRTYAHCGTVDEARRRIREGSARGAASVSRGFAAVLTRKRFCELVGIHKVTLKRWEKAGVVKPRMDSVMGIPTAVFEDGDVAFGKRVVRLLKENPGTLSLREAATQARQESRP